MISPLARRLLFVAALSLAIFVALEQLDQAPPQLLVSVDMPHAHAAAQVRAMTRIAPCVTIEPDAPAQQPIDNT